MSRVLVSEEYMSSDQWDMLLKMLATRAEKLGYSSAIFAHWAATRNNTPEPAKLNKLDFSDTASILAELDAQDAENDAVAEAAE